MVELFRFFLLYLARQGRLEWPTMGTTPNLLMNLRPADTIHNVCLLAHGILARYSAGYQADYEQVTQEALDLHLAIVMQVERQHTGLLEDLEKARAGATQIDIQAAMQAQAAQEQKSGPSWGMGSGPVLSPVQQPRHPVAPEEQLARPCQEDPDSEVKAPARPSQDPNPQGGSFPKESRSPEDLSQSPWPGATPQNPS